MSWLTVRSLQLVYANADEAVASWRARSRRQWGNGAALFVRASTAHSTIGSTPPQEVEAKGLTALEASWEEMQCAFPIPCGGSSVVLEVVSVERVPAIVLGLATVDANAFAARSAAGPLPLPLHVFPSSAISSETVHAVLNVVVHDSPETPSLPPLPTRVLHFAHSEAKVSTSINELFFPMFLAGTRGRVVVANVLCICNDSSDPKSISCTADTPLTTHPCGEIVVGPLQRAYFAVKWDLSRPVTSASSATVAIRGTEAEDEIVLPIRLNPPQGVQLATPFHYWINSQCVSNELPTCAAECAFVEAVVRGHCSSSTGDHLLFVTDKDSGKLCAIAPNTPVLPSPRIRSPGGWSGRGASLTLEELPTPKVDLNASDHLCTLHLGHVHGLLVDPFNPQHIVFGGKTPSYRVTAIATAAGWSVVNGDSQAVFPQLCGMLHFGSDAIILKQQKKASRTQFLRLSLVEISPLDGDETPVGVALISLPESGLLKTRVSVMTAFLLLDTYSLYDELRSTSFPMRGATLHFQPANL